MGCNDMELNRSSLLGKLSRASAGASARVLVCDYKPESSAQLKQYTFATSIQLQVGHTGPACYF